MRHAGNRLRTRERPGLGAGGPGLRARAGAGAGAVLLALCLAAAAVGQEHRFIEPGADAPNFRLNDQHIVDFELEEQRGRVVVIVYTGRHSSDRAREFGIELFDHFYGPGVDHTDREAVEAANPEVVVMIAAYLKGVPGFVKKRVRDSFRTPDTPSALLDWNAEIARRYGYRDPGVNVFVIDPEGVVLYAETLFADRAEEESDRERARALMELIESATI